MFGGIFTVPESPRWLLLQNKEEEARIALRALKPKSESEDSISIELSYMKAAIDEEKRLAQGVSFMDVFRHPIDRRRTLLVVGTAMLNPITGITWHGSKSTLSTLFACTAVSAGPALTDLIPQLMAPICSRWPA